MLEDRHVPCSPAQLDRYLRRIGWDGPCAADAETLRGIAEAHLARIPFENLEIHRGRPMRIGLDALFEDLVDRRRGGYCFQMNELFARVLLAIGFRVERFAARVHLRNPLPRPARSHQLLRVTTAAGERFLADVGFGGNGPLRPMPWRPGEVQDHGIASYQLVDRMGEVLVQILLDGDDDWQDMLGVPLDECWPIDFVYANHAVSTLPDSLFVQHRVVARAEPGLRQTLFDGRFRETRPDGVLERQLTEEEEARVLREVFGIEL